jgi:hypothetical protein
MLKVSGSISTKTGVAFNNDTNTHTHTRVTTHRFDKPLRVRRRACDRDSAASFSFAGIPQQKGLSSSPASVHRRLHIVGKGGLCRQGDKVRVQGLGFRVQGLGFRVHDVGCRV